jgi:hypothetical protein
MEWTFKKVKDFNQTPYDYKSIDLDYKLLKGLQKAVKWDFNQTPSDYQSIDLDYKSLKGLQKAVKRSGMYGMDLQKGERLQPNTI